MSLMYVVFSNVQGVFSGKVAGLKSSTMGQTITQIDRNIRNIRASHRQAGCPVVLLGDLGIRRWRRTLFVACQLASIPDWDLQLTSATTVRAEQTIRAQRRQLDPQSIGDLDLRAFHLQPPTGSATIRAITEWELVTSAATGDAYPKACGVDWGARWSPAEGGLHALGNEFMGGRIQTGTLGRTWNGFSGGGSSISLWQL